MSPPLPDIYQRLLDHFGPQGWWPGDSPLEIMLGAILVQNTNWRNVEKSLDQLREAGLLHLEALQKISVEELAEEIRSSGYYRQKAARLKRLVQFVLDEYGSLDAMSEASTATLREQLLALNGIGPETADSILVYVAHKPSFVIDTYTYRILSRHGWVDFETSYHEMQDLFHAGLEPDAPLFNEYHALLVQLGKDYCRKQPLCEGCPLQPLLPESGPHQPGEW